MKHVCGHCGCADNLSVITIHSSFCGQKRQSLLCAGCLELALRLLMCNLADNGAPNPIRLPLVENLWINPDSDFRGERCRQKEGETG